MADRTSIAAATIAFLLPTTAHARPAARLVYERDERSNVCAVEAELRSAVATRLGYDPFEEAALPTINAAIRRSAAGFEGKVRFEDERGKVHGEKKLTSSGDDCTELTAAMALTISILLDPRAILGGAPVTHEAPPSDPHELPTATMTALETGGHTTPPPPPESPLVLRVGIEALGSVGAAPAPAFGLAAFVGLGKGPYTIDLEARADLPASLQRDDGTGVRSSLLLGTIAPCRHAGIVALCVLASAGALHGEGLNVGTPERDTTFYGALGLRAGLEIPLADQVRLRIHGDALLPITRTTLRNAGAEVWTTPTVSGAVALGLFGHF